MQFEADYYDGICPRTKRVLVSIELDRFLFTVPMSNTDGSLTSQPLNFLINDCHVQARLGSGKRLIDLPDSGRLETDFKELESCLPAKAVNTFWQFVHYAETHKSIILIAFIGIALASWLLLQHGVPAIAKYAALATPVSVEKDLGKQTLDALDNEKLGYFEATKLPVAKQKEIQMALEAMCAKTGTCPAYQLNFRKSPELGANAFALPGGYMVITDELIALAKNNDEIVAVLAHELGHVKGRHALRQTLQGTVSGLIIIAITGDVSAIASGLPALMMNMRYTRELETEADNYALQSLNAACIPAKSFATLLIKLEKSHGGSGSSVPEMLSSHPDTKARIVPFLQGRSHCT
ncbi:MAG: M48 family metallopeptidase [Methylotenera sp.]|nr:M48 family metallopeptidase [Methylotenera sp.]